VSVSVTVLVMPPPEAVTVTMLVLKATLALAVKFSMLVPAPGEGSEAGEKAAVTPDGNPLTDSATAAPGLPDTETPMELAPPCARFAAVALRAKVRLGATGAGMVTLTVAAVLSELPGPLIVTVYVPGATLLAAVSVTVLVPLPGAEKLAGERVAVKPEGKPATDNETAALNPLLRLDVTLVVPLEPAATEIALGEAVKVT